MSKFPWHFVKFPDNSLTLRNFISPWHFPDGYEPCYSYRNQGYEKDTWWYMIAYLMDSMQIKMLLTSSICNHSSMEEFGMKSILFIADETIDILYHLSTFWNPMGNRRIPRCAQATQHTPVPSRWYGLGRSEFIRPSHTRTWASRYSSERRCKIHTSLCGGSCMLSQQSSTTNRYQFRKCPPGKWMKFRHRIKYRVDYVKPK